MINPQQREKYRTVLGYAYAKKVKAILAERGIKNGEGNDFDTVSISHVFNGRRNSVVIEDAIAAAYHKELDPETKNPEAATPGL